jgi:ankyrin repeat protein
MDAAERDPSLATRRFAGATLSHFAAGAGCLEVVALLLRLGVDPNLQGRGRTPLHCVANECASEMGPEVVRALLRAGGYVNACSGVMGGLRFMGLPDADMWRSRERCSISVRQ